MNASIFTSYLNKPISKHSASGLARRDRTWHFFSWVMGLSSQSFISRCPTQLYTRCASWKINLLYFSAFQFQAMYGLLVFYMIFQAVMILKGSYNVVSMKWELRNRIAFDYSSTLQTLFLGNLHVWIWVPVVELGWAQNISILCQTGPTENAFCPQVERVRGYLPPILAPLTQLHGWWHLFAGRSILPIPRASLFSVLHITG